MKADAWGLAPGFHGFRPRRAPGVPPFTSAGGHLNPAGATHGDHAGDLPSLLVNDDGTGELRFTTDRFSLADLSDLDGSALMVHANRDNYANIPDRYQLAHHRHLRTGHRHPGDRRRRCAGGVRRRAAAREPVAGANTRASIGSQSPFRPLAGSETVSAPPAPGNPPADMDRRTLRARSPPPADLPCSPRGEREEPNESDALGRSRDRSGRTTCIRRRRRRNPRHPADGQPTGPGAQSQSGELLGRPGRACASRSQLRPGVLGGIWPSTATTTASGSSTSRIAGIRSSSHTLGVRATRATSWSGGTSSSGPGTRRLPRRFSTRPAPSRSPTATARPFLRASKAFTCSTSATRPIRSWWGPSSCPADRIRPPGCRIRRTELIVYNQGSGGPCTSSTSSRCRWALRRSAKLLRQQSLEVEHACHDSGVILGDVNLIPARRATRPTCSTSATTNGRAAVYPPELPLRR